MNPQYSTSSLMSKFKINYLFVAIALIVTGVMMYLFVSLSDDKGYAIATPRLIMFPLLVCLAVKVDGAPRATTNIKILSEISATILFLIGVLSCAFNFAVTTYVAFVTVFFLAWLGLSWLLAYRTKG